MRADAAEEDIKQEAEKRAQEIIDMKPAAVMCMGEMGVCFEVVGRLKRRASRSFTPAQSVR